MKAKYRVRGKGALNARKILKEDFAPRRCEPTVAITIVADLGRIAVGIETNWAVGKLRGNEEYRRASVYSFEGEHWSRIFENHEVVRTSADLQRFLRGGGHALVSQGLLASWWPEILRPIKCRRHYAPMPWISTERPSPFENDRYVRGALRQLVFCRDEDRCRICGRSVDDGLDITLDVHHVLPYANGGMTNEHNLIVICRTCHDGVADYDDMRRAQLYEKIEISFFSQHRRRHSESVASYRRIVMKHLPGATELAAAVLPLAWPEKNPFQQQLVSRMISDNLAIQWLPIRQWIKLAKQAYR